jgi:hypothetical protein
MRVAMILLSLVALTYLVESQAGTVLSRDQSARVTGGCTVTNFASCSESVTKSEECSQCSAGWQCENSHTGYACQGVTGSCVSCGTCQEDCGGTLKKYGMWSNCTGTFTTDNCTTKWTDAQEDTCSGTCAG